ncbi:MAG: chemotaxis protein CheW [Leptolyngbya sp. SIO3F4]|nr:chemotaxis protein CheW [Leptolyngbya sp. SIO3F4]
MANLLLLFRVGKERYAIKAQSVVEVIPRVNLNKIHQSPPNIAGQFNYQGQIVPVLDLSKLLGGKECRAVLSTRIVLVDLAQSDNAKKLLGLMVEQVTDTLKYDQTTPVQDSVSVSQATYLGEKLLYQEELIQCLHIEQLLTDTVYNQTLESMETGNATAESILN